MTAVADLRRYIGRTVRNLRRKPEGVGHDFVRDLKTRLSFPIQTIFDVGAHIGVTAIEFSDAFPDADVWAFEPHPANLERLMSNLVGKPDVHIHPIGFSDKPGELRFHYDPDHPSMARVADNGETAIDVETLDRFCAVRSIERIDLLKIDVEGHEMNVLRGAHRVLSENRVSVVKLETTVNPDFAYHTGLSDICYFLHPYGYRLFGIYDQFEDVFTDSPVLRRFDAAFTASS